MKKIFALGICALFLLPAAARAQDASQPDQPAQPGAVAAAPDASAETSGQPAIGDEGKITQDGIRKFYDDSIRSFKWPYNKFYANLQNSLADNLESTLTTTVTMPLQSSPMTSTVKLTKDSILKDAQKTYDGNQRVDQSSDIVKMQISPDGKSAVVENRTSVKNVPFAPMVTMDGGGPCIDFLTITAAGQIQITRSECTYEYAVSHQ